MGIGDSGDRGDSDRTAGTMGTMGTEGRIEMDDGTGVTPLSRQEHWRAIREAEDTAVVHSLLDWQDEKGWTQRQAAVRLRDYLPNVKKGATNSTLSRWFSGKRLGQAKWDSLRSLVEATGRNIRDLADVMEHARLEYELKRVNAPISVQEALHRRNEQERRLLADFRVLDSREKEFYLAQLSGAAQRHLRSQAEPATPTEAMLVAEMEAVLPHPTDDPEEALRRALEEIARHDQRQQAETQTRSRKQQA